MKTKTIHDKRYRKIIAKLVGKREANCCIQVNVARDMHITQSTVHRIEDCRRRMDIIEMFDYCEAIGLDFRQFMMEISVDVLGKGTIK